MKRPGSKFYTALLMSMFGISALLFIFFFLNISSDTLLTLNLDWCYLLMAVSLLAAIVFPMMALFSDLKKAKYTFIGLGALLLIYFLGYAIAGNETYNVGGIEISQTVSAASEAGLFAFYSLLIIAVCSIIYAEVSKAIK